MSGFEAIKRLPETYHENTKARKHEKYMVTNQALTTIPSVSAFRSFVFS